MPSFKEKFGRLTEIQQFLWSNICAEELLYGPVIAE